MPTNARPLDHIVLATVDLTTVRDRLAKLGFTVAPDARHPFGTENACVFFADGTYLEPLGVASQGDCEKSAKAGNVFTARDQAFRFRHGPEGMEAIVFKTEDADSDDADFCEKGISAGKMLQFSRPMKLPDGSEREASFKLAFAADLRSPDFYAFTCQRINVPAADRSSLTAHANGVMGISEVVLSENNPSDFESYLQTVTRREPVEVSPAHLEFQSPNAKIDVLTTESLERFFGRKACAHGRGLRGRAIIFSVGSLDAVTQCLISNGIEHSKIENRIVVPQMPGQGVIFAFEEKA